MIYLYIFMIILEIKDVSPRIFGGKTADTGQFPYQVQLLEWGKHIGCSGTILDHRWVITAAHCVAGRHHLQILTVTVDVHSKYENIRNAAYYVIHEGNNPVTFYNDLALIRSQEEFLFGEKIGHILLPSGPPKNREVAVVAGWGYIAFQNGQPVLPRNLQYLKTKIQTYHICSRVQFPRVKVFMNEICAYAKEGKGMCKEDDGAPLVVNKTLFGIFSRGEPCALGFPDVYVNVHRHMNWIRKVIKGG